MKKDRNHFWLSGLTFLIILDSFSHPATAQIQADNTLPTNTLVNCIGATCNIQGGTASGANLFHSFTQFSVTNGINKAVFLNDNPVIRTIIGRVTGGIPSTINGLIAAGGTAPNFDLFLINPSGIIFSPNASLGLNGSFIASTAQSVLFPDTLSFSATPTAPLLSVKVPIGLQFGTSATPIEVNGGVLAVGAINTIPGKTLALIGGELRITTGGYLNAPEGRVELGSVAPNSLVQLTTAPTGWVMGYAGVQTFQDISLMNGAIGSASGGNIQVKGRNIILSDGARLSVNPSKKLSGGLLDVGASESVQLIGLSSGLFSQTTGSLDAGTIQIATKNLLIRDGARIYSQSFDNGQGGRINVNATDLVEISSPPGGISSGIFSQTIGNALNPLATGKGGDITINSDRFILQGESFISTQTLSGGQGGTLFINSKSSVMLAGYDGATNTGLDTQTINPLPGAGAGGTLKIKTAQLTVRDWAQVTASSKGAGTAGNIEITAGSIYLINHGKIRATTSQSNGGNIFLQLSNPRISIWMEGQSEISAEAFGFANAGNITIEAKGLIISRSLEDNNDIVANAIFGRGGRIGATALDILYFRQWQGQRTSDSDFTSLSFNPLFPGEININKSTSPRTQTLPQNFLTDQVAKGCQPRTRPGQRSAFMIHGSGGIPTRPEDAMSSEAIAVGLVAPVISSEPVTEIPKVSTAPPTEIIEAQKIVKLADGTIALVGSSTPAGLTALSCNTF